MLLPNAPIDSSGTTRLFVDGVEQGSFSDSFNYVSRELKIGEVMEEPNAWIY